ncbi:MAG: class I SAM-dependent methyltransferase [Noviherbaspirillum sp.]
MMQTLISPLKALAAYPRYVAADVGAFFSTVARYYPNARFRRADLHCLRAYLLHNPDAICRRYLRDAADDEGQKIYGETFFTTLEAIANAVGLSDKDVVYDLGCGRGRSVFWFNAMYGCKAIGVDINRYFVIQARGIQRKAGIEGVEFILANALDLDYEDATLIYLYGTAFTDAAIAKLVKRFASLKEGTRVVSVSYPLNAYAAEPLFELEQTIKAKYLWGTADIYIQRKL